MKYNAMIKRLQRRGLTEENIARVVAAREKKAAENLAREAVYLGILNSMNCGKTVVKIKPTDNTAERVRAISYFEKLDEIIAQNLHDTHQYVTLTFKLGYMRVTCLYAKAHFFTSCDFVEIIQC